MVIVGWPYTEFADYKRDIEGNYLKTIELVQAFADRLHGAGGRRASPVRLCRTISASHTGSVGCS